jgi:glycosyltransferase involved in cell wall biosynthesis
MKLLVFAHTPPPLHGQSAMVATLVDGFRASRDIEVQHVNARLSRDAGDVGTIRPGKLLALFASCFRACWLRLRHGDAVFYYVPGPGKRGALYRDLIVMTLCRPWFGRLVLHWHASGLGAWLDARATWLERRLARRCLGRADLAIVLAPELVADAAKFAPRRITVVPNCVPDPGVSAPAARVMADRCTVLFLGLCTRSKGLFDTLEGIALANARGGQRFRLVVAGSFASIAEQRDFERRAAELGPDVVRYVGFADESRKPQLWAEADVFCFPTAYPHEGQPLTLIEALAHDVPIVTTRWRAIPSLLPTEHVWFVEAGVPGQIADALVSARAAERPHGELRQHYLENFTPARHLAMLREQFLAIDDSPSSR